MTARGTLPLVPLALLLGLCFLYPVAEVLKWSVHDGSWTLRHLDTVASVSAYTRIILTTVQVAAITALACMVPGYPVAFFISLQGPALRTLLLVAIVVTMWVSVLVRTYAWMVVLGREGVINGVLIALGIIEGPLQMMFTRGAVYLAMIQILLPISILASYSSMAGFDRTLLLASRVLGANPWKAFRTVYFPMTLGGVAAGGLIVMLLSLGFFITPALVGGPSDLFIANVISSEVTQTLNWNLAAALAVALLAAGALMVLLFLLLMRLLGGRRA